MAVPIVDREETLFVDVRIGVTQAPRELSLELPDECDREELRARVDAALAGEAATLWIEDRKGRLVGFPSAKIGYVEIGLGDKDRRIGFGS